MQGCDLAVVGERDRLAGLAFDHNELPASIRKPVYRDIVSATDCQVKCDPVAFIRGPLKGASAPTPIREAARASGSRRTVGPQDIHKHASKRKRVWQRQNQPTDLLARLEREHLCRRKIGSPRYVGRVER